LPLSSLEKLGRRRRGKYGGSFVFFFQSSVKGDELSAQRTAEVGRFSLYLVSLHMQFCTYPLGVNGCKTSNQSINQIAMWIVLQGQPATADLTYHRFQVGLKINLLENKQGIIPKMAPLKSASF